MSKTIQARGHYDALDHMGALNLEKVLFLARGVVLPKHSKERVLPKHSKERVLASEPSTLTIPVKQVKA